MVRDWADLLVHVYTRSWKVFISLCLTIALISTLMGLIILCLRGTKGNFWWSSVKGGEPTRSSILQLNLCGSFRCSWITWVAQEQRSLGCLLWKGQAMYNVLVGTCSYSNSWLLKFPMKKAIIVDFHVDLKKKKSILQHFASYWKDSRKKQRKIVKYIYVCAKFVQKLPWCVKKKKI